MAVINGVSSKTTQERAAEAVTRTKDTRVEARQADFDAVVVRLVPVYEDLTPAQRLIVRNTLDNWAAATNADKIAATHAVTGLYAAVLDLLVDKIQELQARVKALEHGG